jgi:hypothetical protein
MVQSRSGLRFPAEPLQSMGIVGHIWRKKLQSGETVKPGVLGLVNNPHTTPAEFLNNAVVRDGLADHWPEILRLWNRQVNESRGLGGISKCFRCNIASLTMSAV